ncbi:MAG TPA: putative DNA binding domain-containing protein [Bacteroidales bacterium]|nr:putative DNA binding domain-containing protein [Bacteroidales bacterium]
MTESQLVQILNELRSLPAETEVVEFKEANRNYDFNKLGRYFSALSNEANLKGKHVSWLIFGVEDKKKNIVGSLFRNNNRPYLDSLKAEIAGKTTNGITFIEIYELNLPEGRVVMFQIPAAPSGIPVAWEGHYYGRNGQELSPLNIEELDRIRAQASMPDWSSAICHEADISDLDPEAILKARENYKNKFPDLATEVDSWNDITFLNKAKITIRGKVTRTAILLLGKPESEHFISPADVKIRWILKDKEGNEKDYSVYSCPFLLSADEVFKRIRNLKYRYLRDDTIFPEEVDQYEPYVIREALNNCIAHQDYTLAGKINVVEKEDELIFTNVGSFIPGTVENVINRDAPEEIYRNPFLATAMFNLKMVDTIGSGIKRMFNYQRTRFFPMPEYDFAGNRVKLTIIGKVIDINYARVLARNSSLSLLEIMLLDKVQKRFELTTEQVKLLRSKGLIEGKKPNLIISAKVAQITGQKAAYTRNKAFSKQQYFDWIIKGIKDHGYLSRPDIEQLLWDRLSDLYTDKQKKLKITNLLSELREKKIIRNIGSDSKSKWVLL